MAIGVVALTSQSLRRDETLLVGIDISLDTVSAFTPQLLTMITQMRNPYEEWIHKVPAKVYEIETVRQETAGELGEAQAHGVVSVYVVGSPKVSMSIELLMETVGLYVDCRNV
ncbi:MAG: hypothetical protein WD492_00325 [Alkalispirochaeta sp.]